MPSGVYTRTLEARRNISKAKTGVKQSDAAIQNRRLALIGHTGKYLRTSEIRAKIAAGLMGRKHPHSGNHAPASEHRIQAQKDAWNTPGHREIRGAKMREVWQRPEYREKVLSSIKSTQKKVWARPGYKDKQIARMRKSARPNKFEVQCMQLLEKLYPGKFKYTGNGSMLVNSRSADAYSEELNTICLFHGCYWHLGIRGLAVSDMNKRIAEEHDSLPFLTAGYKVLFIWEDEVTKIFEYSKKVEPVK